MKLNSVVSSSHMLCWITKSTIRISTIKTNGEQCTFVDNDVLFVVLHVKNK